jgi:hypothetical protein
MRQGARSEYCFIEQGFIQNQTLNCSSTIYLRSDVPSAAARQTAWASHFIGQCHVGYFLQEKVRTKYDDGLTCPPEARALRGKFPPQTSLVLLTYVALTLILPKQYPGRLPAPQGVKFATSLPCGLRVASSDGSDSQALYFLW